MKAMTREELSSPTQAVIDGTQQWAQDFMATSKTWAEGQQGSFSVDGYMALPEDIPRPTLLITPRMYDFKPYAEWSHPMGYVHRDPKVGKSLTEENNEAWQYEVPLQVDPSSLSFKEYMAWAAEPNQDSWVKEHLAFSWGRYPEHVADRWQKARGKWEEYALNPKSEDLRWPVVYRALGALPELPALDDPNFTYDLRLDPVLRNSAGKLVDSYRINNLCTAEPPGHDWMWDFPSHYYNSGSMPHVPPYQVKATNFKDVHKKTAGRDYKAALFLSETQNGAGEPALMIIHLAGATTVARAVEKT